MARLDDIERKKLKLSNVDSKSLLGLDLLRTILIRKVEAQVLSRFECKLSGYGIVAHVVDTLHSSVVSSCEFGLLPHFLSEAGPLS